MSEATPVALQRRICLDYLSTKNDVEVAMTLASPKKRFLGRSLAHPTSTARFAAQQDSHDVETLRHSAQGLMHRTERPNFEECCHTGNLKSIAGGNAQDGYRDLWLAGHARNSSSLLIGCHRGWSMSVFPVWERPQGQHRVACQKHTSRRD
eukprot:4420192-Amphidinium_carterae.1